MLNSKDRKSMLSIRLGHWCRTERTVCTGRGQNTEYHRQVIVAVMLCALDAHDGHRVLEIGTGTGYHAALLAHRLGAEQVTAVEIDPDMSSHARKALSDTGYGAVTVVTGNGELGYPPGAPYNRVVCTAECATVPYSWVAQTRPGGRILTPWSNSYFNGGPTAARTRLDSSYRDR